MKNGIECKMQPIWGYFIDVKIAHVCFISDSFTILGLWVLGLAVSNINESPLQTNESKTLFLMTSLPYCCIPGLAGTRCNKNLCAKDAGCAGNKITASYSFTTCANFTKFEILIWNMWRIGTNFSRPVKNGYQFFTVWKRNVKFAVQQRFLPVNKIRFWHYFFASFSCLMCFLFDNDKYFCWIDQVS